MALIRKAVKSVILALFYLIPVKKNRVFVSSYYGRGYGDNLKYIVDRLLGKGLEIIWVVSDKKEAETLPVGVTPVIMRSVAMYYYMHTSLVWLDNARKDFSYKKKNQLYIQTWHGGGAQKKCELDVAEKLDAYYVNMAVKDGANTDLMISESSFMTSLYHRAFWYDGPVYECGYPRYDLLFSHDDSLKEKVAEYYGIDKNKEFLLYAPTFRADKSFAAYNIDFLRLQNDLKKRFGKDFVILVHLHPLVANTKGGIDYDGENVINSTFYPDTQELLAASSILIGDYSSINYDFSLQKRPVFRYAADLEEYRNDRDLYFAFEEYPYPCAENNDELEELILGFDSEKYLEDLNAFFDKLGSVMIPGASERIANLILDYCKHPDKNAFFEKHNDKFIFKEQKNR